MSYSPVKYYYSNMHDFGAINSIEKFKTPDIIGIWILVFGISPFMPGAVCRSEGI